MSLRARLNLLITALLLLVMALGTLLLLHNARGQVRAEVESVSVLVAKLVEPVGVAIKSPEAGWAGASALRGLEHLRHIRIRVYDQDNRLLHSNIRERARGDEPPPPQWFSDLMTHNLVPIGIEQEVVDQGQRHGRIVIEADPSYEVAEVWNDTVGLFWLVVVFFLAVNLLVYWAVGRALKPVGRILYALNELERGNLEARLPAFDLKELSDISEKFNGMAQTLQTSITRNHRLSQQLIYLQEEERKSLARDLHDELGQYLTAIHMDGSALLRLSETKYPEAHASAKALVDVTQQVMVMLRAMLHRLRPDILDGLGLRPALEDLVESWRQRNAGVSCISRYAGELGGLPDAVGITAYRVIQECLTNVSRHAGARRVRIEVGRATSASGRPVLRIEVEDDGCGFEPERAEGFGLGGMRERVEGLGGDFRLHSALGGGTRIRVSLPITEGEEST